MVLRRAVTDFSDAVAEGFATNGLVDREFGFGHGQG
jgi:hypothetical protein